MQEYSPPPHPRPLPPHLFLPPPPTHNETTLSNPQNGELDDNFGVRDERRESVIALTLAPIASAQSTVNVVVEAGGKVQQFTMHRDLLCFYSGYFRRVCREAEEIEDGEGEGGEGGVVVKKARIRREMYRREWRWGGTEAGEDLDGEGGWMEVDVRVKMPKGVREIRLDAQVLGAGGAGRRVFAAFVNWMYRGFAGFGFQPAPATIEQCIDAPTLVYLWVFAGRVGVPECQNHCIEGIELWRQRQNIIQTSMLRWVYENTAEYADGQCPLRLLLIDQCAWKLDGKWLLGDGHGMKNEEQFPRQALVDLVSKMRRILSEGCPPSFANKELRKRLYWIEVEDKRMARVLGGN